jgi:hypothetical protein
MFPLLKNRRVGATIAVTFANQSLPLRLNVFEIVSPSGVKPLERNGELTIATRLVHKQKRHQIFPLCGTNGAFILQVCDSAHQGNPDKGIRPYDSVGEQSNGDIVYPPLLFFNGININAATDMT